MESVLDPGYPALEYFVQDGGSRDGTVALLKAFEAELTGWDSGKDAGQTQAINLAFGRIKVEIMGWLNSDDLLLPGSLHHVADYFSRHPEVDVLYGNRVLIEVGGIIPRWSRNTSGHTNRFNENGVHTQIDESDQRRHVLFSLC
jgi:glycosyltransferase involved in cell wall biosynthesis